MAKTKTEPQTTADAAESFVQEAEEVQARGREILDELNEMNGVYVELLEELQEHEATIRRAGGEITRANTSRKVPVELPLTINALVRTHRNLPVTDVAVLPQIVADGPYWVGRSPTHVRFKG
ncbi:hypothetical protein LCGC14_2038640, partial [marine sediment metagenome]